jgi:hypothetical protein
MSAVPLNWWSIMGWVQNLSSSMRSIASQHATEVLIAQSVNGSVVGPWQFGSANYSTSLDKAYDINQHVGFMVLDVLFFLIMAWYVDVVFPREDGIGQRICFCLDPRYWLGMLKSPNIDVNALDANSEHAVLADLDPDILRETRATQKTLRARDNSVPLRLVQVCVCACSLFDILYRM